MTVRPRAGPDALVQRRRCRPAHRSWPSRAISERKMPSRMPRSATPRLGRPDVEDRLEDRAAGDDQVGALAADARQAASAPA